LPSLSILKVDQFFDPIILIDNKNSLTIIIVKMAARRPFTLIYADSVKEHMKAIEPKYYSLIRSTIEKQLLFEPDRETKNRKPLKHPVAFEATWEIRFGPDNRFRVFYEMDREKRGVFILAIGMKKGNQLVVGGEKFNL
jgi:mRNA-degrading endonuclease RelE of RelBE toxin-antitoxin system